MPARSGRAVRVTVLRAVVMAAVVLAMAGTAAAQDAAITLQARNDAVVPQAVLRRAEKQVTRILGDAGVRGTWVDPTTNAEVHALRLVVVITKSRSILEQASVDTLGVATESEEGPGRIAYILWNNVQALVDSEFRDAWTILGYAMAHEIGHLLLGRGSHSSTGLMRARWDRSDLTLAERGLLRFTDDEAARIRRRLTAEPLLLAGK